MTSVPIGPRCSFGVGFRVWGTRAACPGGLVSPRPKVTEGAQKGARRSKGDPSQFDVLWGRPPLSAVPRHAGGLPRPCVTLAPGPSGFHLTFIHIHVYKTHGHSSPAAAGSTSRSCRAMQAMQAMQSTPVPPGPGPSCRVSARLRQLPARTHTHLVCGTRTVRYGPWPGQSTRLAAPECARSCHL